MAKPIKTEERSETFERYFNRERSWLMFNKRVLEEAANPANPLLERAKFLAIFESNLDEFFMVRVSGLIEQFEGKLMELSPDGLTPGEQLELVSETALPMRRRAGNLWLDEIEPKLQKAGVNIRTYEQLTDRDREVVDQFFQHDMFPVCTPVMLQPAQVTPFISNRSLNLAVLLKDEELGTRVARIKIPTVFPRAYQFRRRRSEFIFLEEIIRHHLAELFPGVQILGAYTFRVLRDADIEIRELEAADLVTSIEQTLKKRRFGDPVLLQVSSDMPQEVQNTLMRLLELEPEDVFQLEGLLGMEVLFDLASEEKAGLRFQPHVPYIAPKLDKTPEIFHTVRSGDVVVSHPYDSFRTVEEFVAAASKDPQVIGIKQTLYRVGQKSPIVESLLAAAENGKQVAVMVELKARFDESNNLEWAKALEQAGVHVTFGFPHLKTHAKLCLIVRREDKGIQTYAHVGTGNYNPATARVYTDFGIFTIDPDITQDIAELFNFLTGFSKQTEYRKLLVAPLNLREKIIERIHREIECVRHSGSGRILFKLNSLVDPEVIDALYEASSAGVSIDLIVRGICCLRPGMPNLSENIRVRSVVGRYLEHSRAYYFDNGGNPELYIGSADLMRRNLDRRVEVLAPVQDQKQISVLKEFALEVMLKDNTNAWQLDTEGEYHRLKGDPPFNAQRFQMQNPLSQILFGKSNQ
ncbi:MAG: polyphosphate kinase 1 [Armatimonadetes bacterium]|nr:polyphosphate kinase 1 [Armatimonadota bacterium]